MDYLTRDEVIETVGIKAVVLVDNLNCNITGRVLDNPDSVEFSASIKVDHSDYESLTAYYYQYTKDLFGPDSVDNLNDLDWEVYGYKLN